MSQVVEGTEDNLTQTRRGLFAGNTNATMQPMDVAEAAYYKQHPEEEISYRLGAALAPLVEATAPPADAPEADPLDVEVTPENAALMSQYVTRKEFNHLAERVNHLLFSIEELEGRIEQFNKTAPHKIK